MGCNYFFLPLVPASDTTHNSSYLKLFTPLINMDRSIYRLVMTDTEGRLNHSHDLQFVQLASKRMEYEQKRARKNVQGKNRHKHKPKVGYFQSALTSKQKSILLNLTAILAEVCRGLQITYFHVWRNFTWKLSAPWYHTLGWWHRFDYRQIKDKPGNLRH